MNTFTTQEKLEIVEAAYIYYKKQLVASPDPAFICSSIAQAIRNKLNGLELSYNILVEQHFVPLFVHRKPKHKLITQPWWPSCDTETRKAVFEEMIETLKHN
jgi:hypothetical protein